MEPLGGSVGMHVFIHVCKSGFLDCVGEASELVYLSQFCRHAIERL
jgi:hypothetical protein